MNFRQLEYIIAVERFRNFKRAAVECDIAQSTLSKEIQRLEQSFDIIIFDRSRKPVVPTLKGVDLINKAKEIIHEQKEFIQIALKKKNELSGHLNLAIAEIVAPYIIPLFIKSINKKYPKLEVRIFELSDRRIEDFLIEEKIDAALMVSPSLTHGYYARRIYTEELCLYSSKELTNQPMGLMMSSIDFDDIFLHEDLKDLLIRQIQDIGKEPSDVLRNNKIRYIKGNLETLRNIIDFNGGSMLMPKIAIQYLNDEQQKKVFFFKEKQPKMNVSLISSRGFEKRRILDKIFKDLSAILS